MPVGVNLTWVSPENQTIQVKLNICSRLARIDLSENPNDAADLINRLSYFGTHNPSASKNNLHALARGNVARASGIYS
jgi:hypothetical protein